MQYIDITRPIHSKMAIYPNNPGVSFTQTQPADPAIQQNALTEITLGSHTGTHIDTPAHIHPDGAGATTYPLDQLIGECEVVDVTHVDSQITATDIPETDAPRLLFKTRNSVAPIDEFDDDFVALDDSAAEECVRRKLELVGVDALSIRKRGTKNKVHETLIDSHIVILEGCWLRAVVAGSYRLWCLPLPVDLDGAPVRALLQPIS